MTRRTALQIADDLNAITGGPTLDDSAKVIRAKHAEIERLTADMSQLKLEVLRLQTSLALARGEKTISADNICPNCDTELPEGCGGVFSQDHECLWRKT